MKELPIGSRITLEVAKGKCKQCYFYKPGNKYDVCQFKNNPGCVMRADDNSIIYKEIKE